jgi:hypothetical protein
MVAAEGRSGVRVSNGEKSENDAGRVAHPLLLPRADVASFDLHLHTRSSLHTEGEPSDFVTTHHGEVVCIDDATGDGTVAGRVHAYRLQGGLAQEERDAVQPRADAPHVRGRRPGWRRRRRPRATVPPAATPGRVEASGVNFLTRRVPALPGGDIGADGRAPQAGPQAAVYASVTVPLPR